MNALKRSEFSDLNYTQAVLALLAREVDMSLYKAETPNYGFILNRVGKKIIVYLKQPLKDFC